MGERKDRRRKGTRQRAEGTVVRRRDGGRERRRI